MKRRTWTPAFAGVTLKRVHQQAWDDVKLAIPAEARIQVRPCVARVFAL